jgi:aspartyl-tRNA(Asn)/glutamyl-tRNA(Gln) amidotransferase subunit A
MDPGLRRDDGDVGLKVPLHRLSIAQAGAALRDGAVSAVALAEAALDRIAAHDPRLNAFIRVTPEHAMRAARAADAAFAKGEAQGPLQGIPYAVKDIYDTAGIETTCHSATRLGHIPTDNAEAVARMEAAGAVLIGKLATHEFAIGGPSFDLPFPPARNPWNPEHIPGGSSSGCGAAVAAGFVRTTLGTDTGGSIRWPAAHCGVVGLKPTFGLVSRRGVFPLSHSLDHCGPIGASVEDVALTLGAIAGHDSGDPASARRPRADFTANIGRDLKGLRIGLPLKFHADIAGASSEIVAGIEWAAQRLAEAGAEIETVTLPDLDLIEACGRVVMIAEGYALHAPGFVRDSSRYGRRTILHLATGAAISTGDYSRACTMRARLAAEINRGAMARCHALLTASSLTPPPRFDAYDDDAMPSVLLRTVAFNISGNPALALPTGLDRNGLPKGVQLVGRAFDEATLFRIGSVIERQVLMPAAPEMNPAV